MQIQEQSRNINTYLNNIPYQYKAQVNTDLNSFVRQHECFWVRSSIDKNKFDQYYSFIEVVGFVQIGKSLIELRGNIPHNYPLAPPQFELVYNPGSYDIANANALLNNQSISIGTNAQNQNLIKLNFPGVKVVWQQAQRRNVSEAYKQVLREVNSPPLLVTANHNQLPFANSVKNLPLGRNKSGGLTQRVLDLFQTQIFALQEKQMSIEHLKLQHDYKVSRADFIHRNATKLQKVLKNQQTRVNSELDRLRASHEEILLKGTLDPILIISPPDKQKIQAMARQQAVKQAERKMVQCLQRNMSENKGQFLDHKGMVRDFYEQMFEAQSNYLNVCD